MSAIRKAVLNDIPAIRKLALEIWPDAYGSILSTDQLEYMLELIYSISSLEDQMINKGHQFLLISHELESIGFASYSPIATGGRYRLHKLYVLTSEQHKGLGRLLLQYIINDIKAVGADSLELNVNRHNSAKFFYEKHGFIVDREEDIDIGNEYFMNDYVMILNF